MPVWRETYNAWFWFGHERQDNPSTNRKFAKGISDQHYFYPDFERLREAVNDFTREANRRQAEVKGVVPLTGAVAETYAHSDFQTSNSNHSSWGWGWGLGHGFGAAFTGGFLVIFQQSEEISQEEWALRMAALDLADRLAAVDAEITEAETALGPLRAQLASTPGFSGALPEITEKRSIIGGPKYTVGDKTFDARSTAQSYIDTMTKEPLRLQGEIDRLEARLAELRQRRAEVEAG